MLSASFIFEIHLKMRVFDNKIREHAATYMKRVLLYDATLIYKASVYYSTAAPPYRVFQRS